MHAVLPFMVLVFTYLALSENLGLPNIILGLFIAMGIWWLLRPARLRLNWSQLPSAFLSLVIYTVLLFRDVMRSGLQVVRIVLDPALPIKSGIVAIPPECESEEGRAMGAHAISLPPGELLIEMDEDGTMYIHSLDVEVTRKQAQVSQKVRRKLMQRMFDRPDR